MCPSFRFFIAFTFENYDHYFFYEILILIKSKNINAFCFQIITNQINHDSISMTPKI